MFKHRASIGKSNEYKRYILLLFTLYRLFSTVHARKRKEEKDKKESRNPVSGETAKFAFHSEFIGLSPLVFVSSVVVPSIGTSRLSRLGQTSHASFDEPELCEFPFEFSFFFYLSFNANFHAVYSISVRIKKKKKKRYGRYTREITKRFGGRALSPLPRCLARKSVYIFTRARIEGGRSAYFLMRACNLFDARARK